MSSIYRIVSTGNTILADQSFCDQFHPNDWEYLGEEIIEEVTPTSIIKISAFFDRLGDQLVPLLTSTSASIQLIMGNLNKRTSIDLSNTSTSQALDFFISEGFTLNKEQILSSPVTEEERFK